MLVELWGASERVGLLRPDNLSQYLLLLLYTLVLAIVFWRTRHAVRSLVQTRWRWLIGLSLGGLLASQLLPLRLPFSTQPLTLFTAVPLLLTAILLHPVAAAIVGLFTGLGQALGQSHHLFDLFHFAFAGYLAAILMQQRYIGRVYEWLRQPLLTGPISMGAAAFLVGTAIFVGSTAPRRLIALDQSLVATSNTFWVFLLEGLIGGALVMIILRALPELRPRQTYIPSPTQRSLRSRLLGNFLLFSFVLTVLLITVVYNLSVVVSRQLAVNQMAYNAEVTLADIPEFRTELAQFLDAFEADQPIDAGINEAQLEQIYKGLAAYRRLIVVNKEQEIIATYPPQDDSLISLSSEETAALANVFATNDSDIVTPNGATDEQALSFIIPLSGSSGQTDAALVGRVSQLTVNNLIVGLQGTAGEGVGFIVNEQNEIIAHPDPARLRETWQPPQNGRSLPVANSNRSAYQIRLTDTNSRELVYSLQQATDSNPWTVVISVPYAVVLDLAISIGLPLLLVLLLVTGASYAYLAVQSREITRPLAEMVKASKKMAAGSNWTPSVHARRDDEIGQLGQAFSQMQRSMKKRLNELSLLLAVSHNVSTKIDLNQGVPAILRGALRGTGASGARAVVLNPSGGNPLTFGEGPSAKEMAWLDRHIMAHLRYQKELILSSPEEIRVVLDLADSQELPVPSLMAIPLFTQDRFRGVIWLGYRQAHTIDLSERNLLHTLAGQAAVLVQNAHLFATAEGGRRRLAAVLASTSDAVIVTDPTERVLLINPAMERIFGLHSGEVTKRPVANVLKVGPLVEALTGDDAYTHNVEVQVEDGRVFYASVSRIVSQEGQVFGRVAVLRDITHLKEIDEMKSDFVSTVSHDLRNPLTFMRGYVTMLPMVGELNEKQHEYVAKITNGIDQMAQLVDDLLDLSRIEAGIDFQQDDIEVRPFLQDIADEYWQHAHLAGIKIQVDVGAGVSTIRGDQALIRQAVTNLVSNGIKYAPDSGPMVLRAEQRNGKVIISVKDNGPGIPEQAQVRLFEKFYRVKQPGTEKVKGSGMGLAIVKTIAERHGGTAGCYSSLGKGSTFFIELPCFPPSQNGSSPDKN